jgi:fucose permease
MPIALPPRNRVKGSDPISVLRQFARQPAFAIFLLLILLGGGNEASMAGWTSSFVIASGMSASVATWVLSSHWLGLILSRALFSGRVDRAKEIAVERSAVLSALVLLVLVVSPAPVVVMFGPFVVGMCMALVMPTSLALAGERIQGNPGALFGGLLTLAQIGGMVLPASVGFVAQYTSVRFGLALVVASYGAIAVLVRRLSHDDFQRPPKAE